MEIRKYDGQDTKNKTAGCMSPKDLSFYTCHIAMRHGERATSKRERENSKGCLGYHVIMSCAVERTKSTGLPVAQVYIRKPRVSRVGLSPTSYDPQP